VWLGRAAPRWPSFMAVVERAEREVVVELGVPLFVCLEVSYSGSGEILTGLQTVCHWQMEEGEGLSVLELVWTLCVFLL